jgi:5'-nucleotidase
VGAALTAATHGCPAIAVSLGPGPVRDYSAAATILPSIISGLLSISSGTPITLNVNVPNGAPSALRGIRIARLASFGSVQTNITELNEGYVAVEFAELDPHGESDSDATLLNAGYATVTALAPVCEASSIDLDHLLQQSELGSLLLRP